MGRIGIRDKGKVLGGRRRYGYGGIRYLGEVDRVFAGGGILVVDTGKMGGWAMLVGGEVRVGYIGLVGIGGGRKELDVNMIKGLMGMCCLLVIEDVGLIYGVGKGTAYSMGKQVGMWWGMGEGMGLAVRSVGSRDWHAYVRDRYGYVLEEGSGREKYDGLIGRGVKETKAESMVIGEYLMGRYNIDFRSIKIRNGGWDGVCDAMCLLDFTLSILKYDNR